MSRKALEEQRYELIKAHILHPAESPLPPEQQEQFSRLMSMAGLLDRYPIERQAVALHMKKYKSIKRTQAYEDAKLAKRLFPTIYNNSYEFWQTWLLNDISESIRRLKGYRNVKAEKVIASLYSVMIKAIGEKPTQDIDPKLVEQHTFILTVNLNGTPTNVDIFKFLSLPENARKRLADAVITEIGDVEAAEIVES